MYSNYWLNPNFDEDEEFGWKRLDRMPSGAALLMDQPMVRHRGLFAFNHWEDTLGGDQVYFNVARADGSVFGDTIDDPPSYCDTSGAPGDYINDVETLHEDVLNPLGVDPNHLDPTRDWVWED